MADKNAFMRRFLAAAQEVSPEVSANDIERGLAGFANLAWADDYKGYFANIVLNEAWDDADYDDEIVELVVWFALNPREK